ncbi:response regulator [Thermoproteota archaeon]
MQTSITKKLQRILLVEDNPGDIRYIQEILKDTHIQHSLDVIKNGNDVIPFLQNELEEKNSLPDMILLDMNLPQKSGKDILTEIKNDHRFEGIPVVILTVSEDDEDILHTYNLKASCFLSKPINTEDIKQIILSQGQATSFYLSSVS